MSAGRVVLVTGVARGLGARFARRIADDPAVDRVVGVDVAPPRGDLGPVAFVRADIRNPVIAKVIVGQGVDTVVHLSVDSGTEAADRPGARPDVAVGSAGFLDGVLKGPSAPGRARTSGSSAKEHNVIGTMQLLAACQKAPGVARLVVRSDSAVYGVSSRDPASFTEQMTPRRAPRGGFARDVSEVEGYVRGFARRRPDVTVTVLRPAPVVGAETSTPLVDYLRLPVVPTVLGYDARLQLLHEEDLLAVLQHAVVRGIPGTFNVAGAGVLLVSQALRRLRRPTVPLPATVLRGAGLAPRLAGLNALGAELTGYLHFGRGLDTQRMRTVLGFHPAYDTAGAVADLARSLPPAPDAARRLLDLLSGPGGSGRLEASRG